MKKINEFINESVIEGFLPGSLKQKIGKILKRSENDIETLEKVVNEYSDELLKRGYILDIDTENLTYSVQSNSSGIMLFESQKKDSLAELYMSVLDYEKYTSLK